MNPPPPRHNFGLVVLLRRSIYSSALFSVFLGGLRFSSEEEAVE